ncbi:MAG: protoporphyrinogen/coproporphyrinogen oxidase [Acidimicrobiia bacterium]
MTATETLILGGGLAGLSAAYHARGEYEVLERDERVGGLCQTQWYDGFGFDRSIHILFTKQPELARLICDELLEGRYHDHTRSSWVYSHGRYTGYPFQSCLHGLPTDVATECLLGLIEAHRNPPTETPANFEEWAYATFGDGIARHFFLPYNERVWATPPSEMDYRWIADRVAIPDLETVVRGALEPPVVRWGPNSSFWYPEAGGIEALPRGLMAKLDPARVHLDTEVAAIDPAQRLVTTRAGESYHYEDLISSLPLPAVIKLMPDVPERVRAAAAALRWNTVYTVLLGIRRPEISDQHWVYFHEDEFLFHRISYPMNFSETLVPPGCSSVMAEISHSAHRDLTGRDLVGETIEGLQRIGIVREDDEIVVRRVAPIAPAYVIYTLDHRAAVDTLVEWLRSVGLRTVGRFGEWEYFNMDQAIASGRDAMQAVDAARVVDLVAAEDESFAASASRR